MKHLAILCSGLERRIDRGYENASRNLFENLNRGVDSKYCVTLFKGSGNGVKNEIVICSFSNQKWIFNLGTKLLNDSYGIEYMVLALNFTIYQLFHRNKYYSIYSQEPRVIKTLQRLSFMLKGKPKLIFGLGTTLSPEHYVKIGDRIQIVNIEFYNQAISCYPNILKFHLIPNPANISKICSSELTKENLRIKYNIQTKYVLLTVGSIDKLVKRMNYVVDEACKLNSDWTLVMCGKVQEEDIINDARNRLGSRFIHMLVSPLQIAEIYNLSDVFVLASFKEGFPNVVLEAMQNGIPLILQKRLLYEWALNDKELLIDMSKSGELSNFIISKDATWFINKGKKMKIHYENNYTWNHLKPLYEKLLFDL